MDKRTRKDLLYEQVARVGKALASPKRLEILEMLAQGEKAVETIAGEVGIDVKLASAHLKALKEARLVQVKRDGKRMIYRLSGAHVAQLGVTLRQVAEELLAQAKRGEVVVLDVRPPEEFDTAHLPYARSVPLPELAQRLAELPRDVEIVAYCRGPFCLMSDEAVKLLREHGYRARKTFDGVREWQSAGL